MRVRGDQFDLLCQRFPVESRSQDLLDAPIASVAEVQRTGAGRLQPLPPVALLQTQDGLDRAQAVQRTVGQQTIHHRLRGGSQDCRALPTDVGRGL